MSEAGPAQAEPAWCPQSAADAGHSQGLLRSAWPLLEPLLLACVAPLALFPERFPRPAVVAALGLLLVPALVRPAALGRPHLPALARLSLGFMLLVALPFSLWATPFFWTLTWPKLASLLWSVAVFYAVVDWPGLGTRAPEAGPSAALPARLTWLTWAYLALGAAFTLVAMLGLAAVDKIPGISDLAARLPAAGRLLLGRPEGVSPNEAAGMLVLFAPLALTLLVAPLPGHRPILALGQRTLLALLAVFFAGALVLTQSRAGLLGFSAALAFLFVTSGRRVRLLLGCLALFAVAGVWVVGPARIVAGLLYPAPLSSGIAGLLGGVSLNGRGEIWQRAFYGIGDFPLTGMGLGAFRQIMYTFYPLDLFGPSYDVAHAHNLYLQTALDLGLPGMAAFLLFLVAAGFAVARLYRRAPAEGAARYWAAGLGAALFGHAIYSVFDAVVLGAKPGVALWFLLGLIFAAGNDLPAAVPVPAPPALRRGLMPLLIGFGHEGRAAIALIAAGLTVLALVLWPGRGLLYLDQGNVYAARAAFVSRGYAATAAARLAQAVGAGQPRANWTLGLLARWQGDDGARRAAQSSLVEAVPDWIYPLSVLEPDDETLATLALARDPASPAALAWRAGQLRTADPAQATRLYQRALVNEPGHWAWWIGLGNAYEALGAIDSARTAYETGCGKVIGIRPCFELTQMTSGE